MIDIMMVTFIIGGIISVLIYTQRKKAQKIKIQQQEVLKQARLREEILHKTPQKIEEAFVLLEKLQQFIDKYITNGEFYLALPFVVRKAEIYEMTRVLIRNIEGLENLLPTLLEEQQKNQISLRDVRNRIWTQQYNLVIEMIKYNQSKQPDSTKLRESVIEAQMLVENRLVRAREEGNETDITNYESLLAQHRNALHLHDLMYNYRQYEAEFNRCSNDIKLGKWTEASQQLIRLQKQLQQYLGTLLKDISGSPHISSLVTAADQLSHQVSRVFDEVRGNLNAQLQGIVVKPIQITEIQTDIRLPEFVKLTVQAMRVPLHAKVVLLGESSVGKTHLVLSMTGRQYSERQGSTIGVDKFFLPVSLPLEGLKTYDPQLCFWDLGDNWNFRAVNELFLHEAAMILLVFDVTRSDTFHQLQYWIDMVKTAQIDPKRIFIIGNKLDAGGITIATEILTDFQHQNQLLPFYFTSAVTGEGVRTVAEDLVGAIDWSMLIRNVESSILNNIGGWLISHRKTLSITRILTLFNEIQTALGISDPLLLKSIIRSYAAQELIQMSSSDVFIILDPVKIDKLIARLISIAAKQNGDFKKGDLSGSPLSESEFNDLMAYLCLEQICFPQGKEEWIFPNVIHRDVEEKTLDDWTQQVLQTGTEIRGVQFWGPGDMVFSRITVVITREWGTPQYISNTFGLWTIGSGKEKTVALLQFSPGSTGGLIRIKVGGARANLLIDEVLHLIHQFIQPIVSKVEEIA